MKSIIALALGLVVILPPASLTKLLVCADMMGHYSDGMQDPATGLMHDPDNSAMIDHDIIYNSFLGQGLANNLPRDGDLPSFSANKMDGQPTTGMSNSVLGA